jgi:hypothetical protein
MRRFRISCGDAAARTESRYGENFELRVSHGFGREEDEDRCELSRFHALLIKPDHGAERRRGASNRRTITAHCLLCLLPPQSCFEREPPALALARIRHAHRIRGQ